RQSDALRTVEARTAVRERGGHMLCGRLLRVQTVGATVPGTALRLRKMVDGTTGIVGAFRVAGGCCYFVTEIEIYLGLRRKFGYFYPDERQLIDAVPFFEMKLQFSLVISG